ncbi:MAG: hypothetical protein KKA19_06585 [Candidatus Margulisbacteria bacterium]|nr:hypothetical protein [Candidatus Margulisiibacteriota bacterium]
MADNNILKIGKLYYQDISKPDKDKTAKFSYFKIDDHVQFNTISQDKVRTYKKCFNKCVKYFLNNSGNAGKVSFKDNVVQQGQKLSVRTAYHSEENEGRIHLGNGGASTSETHVRSAELMLYHAIINKDKEPFIAYYNYSRLYLMPGDGWASKQLPEFPKNKYYAQFNRFMHWAYQVTPGNKPEKNYVFANDRKYAPSKYVQNNIMNINNTTYKMYDEAGIHFAHPCIALGADGYPDFNNKWDGANPSFKFGVATDADGWYVVLLDKATKYGVGNFSEDITAYKKDFEFIMKSQKYPGAIYFGSVWGGNIKENWGGNWWLGKELYLGYQAPTLNYIFQQPELVKNVVALGKDAQDEFFKQTGIQGPLMPLYTEEKDMSKFDWLGYDNNTHWLPFQARYIDNLAETFERAQGDTELQKEARKILDTYFKWLAENTEVTQEGQLLLPYAIYTPAIHKQGASHPAVKFYNDFVKVYGRQPKLGEVIRLRFDPSFYALTAQALIKMAKVTKEEKYLKFGEQILNTLVKKQEKSGGFIAIDNNEPLLGLHYGFMNAEAGVAFGEYCLLK